MRHSCVYTHINIATGEVFYIGKASDCRSRPYQFGSTQRNAKWNEYFADKCNKDKSNLKVELIKTESEGEALKLEWDMIVKLRPCCNSQYIPDEGIDTTVSSKDERKNSVRKQIRWNKELVEAINQARGEESFSGWVMRQLWEAVKRVPKSGGECH